MTVQSCARCTRPAASSLPLTSTTTGWKGVRFATIRAAAWYSGHRDYYRHAPKFAQKALREVPYVAFLVRSNFDIEGVKAWPSVPATRGAPLSNALRARSKQSLRSTVAPRSAVTQARPCQNWFSRSGTTPARAARCSRIAVRRPSRASETDSSVAACSTVAWVLACCSIQLRTFGSPSNVSDLEFALATPLRSSKRPPLFVTPQNRRRAA